jgi:2-polyprenyl-6-hydroxyphenyl methylase/3-demethylubiquinone-9 3-methyltransferase
VEGFVLDAAVCPEDEGALERHEDAVRCTVCGRTYGVEKGVLTLLPDRLAHLNAPPAEDRSGDEDVRWIEDELEWWNPWHHNETLKPFTPRAGLRGRSRERHLFRHVRDRVGPQPLVIEMGAGVSRTVSGLWPTGPRYIATDISLPALQAGRALLGAHTASIQCDANTWPFREGSADIVLILGVLHHLSDWRTALARACRTVKPGGYLLLHEAVSKPRVLARFRAGGMDDGWVSPHEGDVPASALRGELERTGRILRWRGEESPMRFGLVRYLVLKPNRHERLEDSPALTVAFDALDQAFGRGPGRLAPSLGFNEVTVVWQRAT